MSQKAEQNYTDIHSYKYFYVKCTTCKICTSETDVIYLHLQQENANCNNKKYFASNNFALVHLSLSSSTSNIFSVANYLDPFVRPKIVKQKSQLIFKKLLFYGIENYL